MAQQTDLTRYLADQGGAPPLNEAIQAIAEACIAMRRVIADGAIAGNLGLAGAVNVQDEQQKKLDVLTNDMLCARLRDCPAIAGIASEEMPDSEATGRTGGILATFDPLDGSSNADVNLSVGTIFSLLAAPEGRAPQDADFLRPGREQLAAGYVIYGPQTNLVVTVSSGVTVFTLDANEVWRQTGEGLSVPAATGEFAINASNQRHWAASIQTYVADCLAGKTGPRAKNFNMRWTASMVADVHRILHRGGVFLYPWDAREPDRPGKLRLMYEGNPMALLIERAGGKATDGVTPLLDVVPTKLHQRVAVVLGSAEEVDTVGALSAS